MVLPVNQWYGKFSKCTTIATEKQASKQAGSLTVAPAGAAILMLNFDKGGSFVRWLVGLGGTREAT